MVNNGGQSEFRYMQHALVDVNDLLLVVETSASIAMTYSLKRLLDLYADRLFRQQLQENCVL